MYDRLVAVKFLKVGLLNPDRKERLFREARELPYTAPERCLGKQATPSTAGSWAQQPVDGRMVVAVWFTHMKTTIDIADPLLNRVKRLAEKRRTTLKALLETALRDLLEAEKTPSGPYRLRTHVFEGRGLQPGLSWDDWASIREVSYEGRGG